MHKVAINYCIVIDDITGNKTVKLQQYELDNDDWNIVKDLLCVLKVSIAMLQLHAS